MGQRSLNTVITIGGNVDGSFGKLGSALLNLGSMLDSVSSKAFNFGKESVLSYRDYDDLMRETQAVGEFTTAQMEHLDTINRTLAQTTTYTPNQIAEAEVLLGQLGLTTTQIQDMLIPSLNLAMAGNISLADSVGYLYAALKSTDAPLSYADELTDQMAVAAAKGAADVDTLGESLERLGSGAKMFKGGSREILTLLTLISDFGEDMRGAEAGTALRNFALSLFAPTGKTKEVIAMLETLGMTTDEYNAYLEEEGIVSTAAAAAIEELGLSLYDDYGNARSMLEIIPQLNTALSSMSDEVRNPILRQIFGKRGFTTASNLMAVVGSFGDMYTAIDNSDGAAERMVETMQGGLGGALRELEAASTLLQNTFGEQASGDVQFVAELLHGISVDMANMDTTAIAGMTGMLEVIAVAGPGLLAAGGFVRTLGLIFGNKGAAIATGAIAVAGAINGIRLAAEAYNEAQLQNTFGTLEFDTTAIITDIQSIGDAYATERAEIDSFKQALTEAVTAYEAASTDLAGKLLSGLITQKTFTQPEIDGMMSLGEQMSNHVLEGIRQSTAANMSYWEMLWGESYSDTSDPALQGIMEAERAIYDASIAEATQLGANLRQAIVDSLAGDGTISQDEYDKIRDGMDALNEAMVQAERDAQDRQQYIERQEELHRAASMSSEDGIALLQKNAEERNATLAQLEKDYRAMMSGLTWDTEKYGIEIAEEHLLKAQTEYEERRDAMIAGYDEHERAIVDALMSGGTYAGQWDTIKSLYDQGFFTDDGMAAAFNNPSAIPWAQMSREEQEGLLDAARQLSFGSLSDILEYSRGNGGEFGNMAAAIQDYAYNVISESFSQFKGREMNYQQFGVDPYGEFAGQFSMALPIEVPDGAADGAEYSTGFQASVNATPAEQLVNFPSGSSDGSSYTSAFQGSLKTATQYVRIVTIGGVSLGGGATGKASASAGTKKFAEGGRATEASIFGEAGPEWAIPEEHTSRTAALLNAAREASGFGWGELIARTGGLNANPNHTPTQLVYSPTIYANDATDVEAKLLEDKERLDRWWRDRVFREEMEAY